ncbi:MAG: hypothetical protein ABI878_12870 [Acidobacteriota bacterium]
MQFKLFDSLSGGAQIGGTITDLPVVVAQGIFASKLDFGSNALSGANRWLEIAVRHNSGEGYVTLSPREQIGSSPYSVRTLSAATADVALDSQRLGGVNAAQYVQTTDARLSDARNPLPGSASYIQNTASPQTASLNLSGPVTSSAGINTAGNISASGGSIFGGSIITNGSLSVGSTAPANHRLAIFNAPPWTNSSWRGALEMEDQSAIGWRTGGANPNYGISHNSLGLFFFRTQSFPGNTVNPPTYDLYIDNNGRVGVGTTVPTSKLEIGAQDALKVVGFQPFITFRDGTTDAFMQSVNGNLTVLNANLAQNGAASGLLKFGILINADGTMNLCYNPQTPAVCGVSVSHPQTGYYDITFPQQINSRIFSATLALPSNFSQENVDVFHLRPTGQNTLRVRISTFGPAVADADNGFYLAVF